MKKVGREWWMWAIKLKRIAKPSRAAKSICNLKRSRSFRTGGIAKGDVLAVAQVAGIMAAKKTHELIPMCHPLLLTHVGLDFTPYSAPDENGLAHIAIEATARLKGQTGVEMEALTAVSVAGLTIYDMCKAVDRAMRIESVRLAKKSGGKSGTLVLE